VLGPVLFVNVYMPTDYCDNESYDSYDKVMIITSIAVLKSLFMESDAIFLAVVGDLNCSPGSRFLCY